MENVLAKIAPELRAMRAREGLTQKQLAKLLAVDQSMISKWENGLGTMTITQLSRYCSVFGVGLDDLASAAGLVQQA
jgi:transcriptional regulator with XRE-family HTH domain